jgi:hypothetical protein
MAMLHLLIHLFIDCQSIHRCAQPIHSSDYDSFGSLVAVALVRLPGCGAGAHSPGYYQSAFEFVFKYQWPMRLQVAT